MHNIHYRRRAQGFTLVELLVTIAIIAVLAALSMSVYNKMSSKGREVGSVSNMKQLSLAAVSYATELSEFMPATYWGDPEDGNAGKQSWVQAIAPYVYSTYEGTDNEGKSDGIFRDPTSPEGRQYDSSEFRPHRWSEIGYMTWSNGTDTKEHSHRIMLTRTNDVSRQPWLSPTLTGAGVGASGSVYNEGVFNSRILLASERYRNGMPVCFCNGSIRLFKNLEYAKIQPPRER